MKQYEIWTEDFEFRFGRYKGSIPEFSEQDIEDLYFDQNSFDPVRAAVFDNMEEAEAEFRKNYADTATRLESTCNGFWVLRGDIAYIEEANYTEDREFDYGNIVVFSCAPYKKETMEED